MAEEDREFKHVCKFCSKRFPCGRSLGGHMRSHMVNDVTISQSDGTKITKKKLPPLTSFNVPNTNKIDSINYGLRENPRKTWRIGDQSSTEETFGDHKKGLEIELEMREEQQDSWTSQSDNETVVAAATARKRRSKRRTKFVAANSCSFASSSASEIEQEEVAMCLIMLSMDKGVVSSVAAESSVSKIEGKLSVSEEDSNEDVNLAKSEKSEPVIEFGKRKVSDSVEASSKFECTTCNKTFHSFQALGGHRASHKKIKTSNSIEPFPKPNSVSYANSDGVATEEKKCKGHECPICFKVFQSGQALGGHKRSHLVNSTTIETKTNENVAIQEPIPVIRDFLDLNLPAAPDDEENNRIAAFNNPWWIRNSHESETLLCLI